MAPKVSEVYMEERRNQILDAAAATFSRKGLHQTTIEDIRLEAGMSRGAVYHYFKAKVDIIDAIRQRSAELEESIHARVAEADGPESGLVALIDATAALMASPESMDANRLAIFLWAESLVNERIMEGQLPSFKPYLDVLATAVGDAQGVARLSPGAEHYAAARVIIGALMGLQVQLTWEPDMDVEASVSALVSMLTGGFAQDTPNT